MRSLSRMTFCTQCRISIMYTCRDLIFSLYWAEFRNHSLTCPFSINRFRLIYGIYGYKSWSTSEIGLSGDKATMYSARFLLARLTWATIPMTIFLICFLGKGAPYVIVAWKVALAGTRNKPFNYQRYGHKILTWICLWIWRLHPFILVIGWL